MRAYATREVSLLNNGARMGRVQVQVQLRGVEEGRDRLGRRVTH